MNDENQDLLDLCQLTQLEEGIILSPGPELDATLKAIEEKKQQLIKKILETESVPEDA